jgi:methionyl-tRNA formyltransferase
VVEVSLCSKLDKEDRLVDVLGKSAIQIYNQWRAFLVFPATCFVDSYFQGEVKVLEANLPEDVAEGVDSGIDPILVGKKYQNWLVTKQNKQQKAYLICKDKTLLQVTKIQLETGRQIDFSGYQFVE